MKLFVMLLTCLAAARAETHVLVVAGLGGEREYEQRFSTWAGELGKLSGAQVLAGAAASRDGIRSALAQIAKSLTPQDDFVLVLIGHGTFDGVEYRFALPGPDITAIELADWLNRIPAGRQVVVNATSASGACMDVWRAPNRVVVTATKSGNERNATVFARYWVEALRDPAADTDKNETVTVLEAFHYAAEKTKKFYESQKRLATEHPQISDAGGIAGRIYLARFGATEKARTDPAKRALLARREQLEQEIDKLKHEKAAMPLPEYKKRLEALLIELAKTQAEIDR